MSGTIGVAFPIDKDGEGNLDVCVVWRCICCLHVFCGHIYYLHSQIVHGYQRIRFMVRVCTLGFGGHGSILEQKVLDSVMSRVLQLVL